MKNFLRDISRPVRFLSNLRQVAQEVAFPPEVATQFLQHVQKTLAEHEQGGYVPKKKGSTIQVSDKEATWAERLMKEKLHTSKSPETKVFLETAEQYKHGQFPVLFITGLLTPKVALPHPQATQSVIELPELKQHMAMFAGLAGALGLQFRNDEKCSRIRAVTPNSASSSGFDSHNTPLSWHSDHYGNDDMPSYVPLFAVQNKEKAVTQFLSAQNLFDALEPEHQKILQRKEFVELDHREEYPIPYASFAVFSRNEAGGMEMHYGRTFVDIQGLSKEARTAFKALQAVVDLQQPEEIIASQGSLIVINNKGVIHRRKEFTTDFAPDRRLLLRADMEKAPDNNVGGRV